MKQLYPHILSCLLLIIAAGPGRAATLLDDTFADGTRNNQNLPTDSAWFFSTAADVTTTTAGMALSLPGSSFMGITYFGTNSSSPVSLGMGDTLTASIKFTFNNVAVLNTSTGFRLGLFDFADSTLSPKWVTADGFSTSSQGTNVQGYALFQNMGVTFNNASPMHIYKRTTVTDGSLLGTTGDWTSLAGGPGNTNNFPGFTSGGQYLLRIAVQRADAVSLAISIFWQNLATGASLATSVTDSAASTFNFDGISLRPTGAGTTATNIVFNEVRVDLVSPGTASKTDQWAGGVNNNWDTNTLNWTNNGVAAAYTENDLVLFNDSAQTGTVNLVGSAPHTPSGWTVTNNLLNYVFAGTNSIGGAVSLDKFGTASLRLSESGDSFTGGITVNSGAVILDEAASAISGGLIIAAGATAQIGNNDGNGGLPSGPVADNGALVFSQTITNLVSTAVSGGGTLTQNGSGTLALAVANAYTGNTLVLQGTLALTGLGAIANSANVIVSNATLDVSAAVGTPSLNNLDLTNAVIFVGSATVNVSTLNLGGSSNTINVRSLPNFLFYPTNVILIESANGINGNNLVLGSIPAGNPPYAGSLGQNGNAVVLTLTSGPPVAMVSATVTFSATNSGWPLNPAFCGLSYEKSMLTGNLFVSNNTALINMFSQIAPAVLRVGGNSVDRTCWGGLSNTTPITAAQVDAFAGFVKALPANWRVIYGINMATNTPANCAAEAAYAANALGSHLLGFEIGNECDLYSGNGIRPYTYTYTQFLSEWRALAGAVTNAVPGWAITNGGKGWTLTGPASAGNTFGYTVPFAGNEAGIIFLLTQHYYRGNGGDPGSTLQLLLTPDASLPGTVGNLVTAATAARLPLGFRMDECGSFYNGGAPNVSDAYGTALWALDFMCTLAINGCQGVNFHGGGDGTGYTPIADNGTTVVQARPEFYGLKMFSLFPAGNILPAVVSLSSNINFTAYGVRQTGGAICALLNNKDTNNGARVTVNLGPSVTAAQATGLTGPALNSTNGYTLGGAEINADGSWAGGVQSVITATNGQITIIVPPISAVLLNPVVTGDTILCSLSGNQLSLSWPSNYTGWLLQSNATGLATSDNWFTVPGSTNVASIKITVNPALPNVFFRMVQP